MNWEGHDRMPSYPVLSYYPRICLEELRKTVERMLGYSSFVLIFKSEKLKEEASANHMIVTFFRGLHSSSV
jgi:hypothetical protein